MKKITFIFIYLSLTASCMQYATSTTGYSLTQKSFTKTPKELLNKNFERKFPSFKYSNSLKLYTGWIGTNRCWVSSHKDGGISFSGSFSNYNSTKINFNDPLIIQFIADLKKMMQGDDENMKIKHKGPYRF